MRWVPDSTGRFKLRPYYDQQELDYECQRLVTGFLTRRYGECRFPLSTDDLTVLIEQDTSDLDLYADLSPEGDDVAGLTAFFPHRKPAVSVAQELSVDYDRKGYLRTTLAHEYGHVKFHAFLWEFGTSEMPTTGVLRKIHAQRLRYSRFRDAMLTSHGGTDGSSSRSPSIAGQGFDLNFRCNRASILDAPVSDWMEWQASYVCGAILMPLSALQTVVRTRDPDDGLVSRVAEAFDVSLDAARVRLEKLDLLPVPRCLCEETR